MRGNWIFFLIGWSDFRRKDKFLKNEADCNVGASADLAVYINKILIVNHFLFCLKNPKALVFLTFLQIRLKLEDSYSIISKTIKSNRIQEIVI